MMNMSASGILSTIEYDPDGWLELELDDASTGLSDFHRRATVVETLDNGVFLDSMGTTDAGRKLNVIVRCSEEHATLLAMLCRVYEQMHLALADGLFLVTALDGSRTQVATSLQLTILEKVSL